MNVFLYIITYGNMLKGKREDIAVIGMSCKFPGADNYEAFWNNLIQNKDSVSLIPTKRWDYKEYEDNVGAKWGAFISNEDKFDSEFFNISNIEAQAMDPQQRIMLELAWNCFEDAGIKPSSMSDTKTGVYIATFNNNFEELINKGEEDIQAHYSTGTSSSIIPNRLSYWFNFRGPSVQVDTACSGSITALDIACQAIRSKKCNMALVGGISLILTPSRHISFSKMRMLSKKGLCNTFDDSADGYVRGEGAGLLLLKPLKNALADHDNIHAIIRGCAINHGGKVRSLTYPNPNAQAEVIVNAFRQAEVSPEDINYIEAHGTGTPKGDPIEMQGLMQAFTTLYGNRSVKSETCCLGSGKPNIGHLESAAGVAGIIKTVLSMENRRIPPLHGYKKLNSRMNLDNTPFYITAEPSEFKRSNENSPLIAGVSSFGFGGTNGHIVLQEAPKNETEENSDKKLFLICLSAKDKNALHEKARNLLEWLSRNSDSNLSDVEATLINGREHFDNRVAIICSNVNDLSEKLNKFSNSPISQNDIFVGFDCDNNKNTDDTSRAPIGEKLGSLDYKTILKNIAESYAKGFDNKLSMVCDDEYKHLALPGYPFKRTAFRIPYENNKSIKRLNPLLHKNISTFSNQHYISQFVGTEDFFGSYELNDKKTAPFFVYLEMAKKALELSCGDLSIPLNLIKFNSVNYDYLDFSSNQRIVLDTILKKNDKTFSISIYDRNKKRDVFIAEIVLLNKPANKNLKIDEIKNTLNNNTEINNIYDNLKGKNFANSIFDCNACVLSQGDTETHFLSISAGVESEAIEFVLSGISAALGHKIHIKNVCLYGEISGTIYAESVIDKNSDAFDVKVFDEAGNLLLSATNELDFINDFKTDSHSLIMKPVWEIFANQNYHQTNFDDKVLIVSEGGTKSEQIQSKFKNSTIIDIYELKNKLDSIDNLLCETNRIVWILPNFSAESLTDLSVIDKQSDGVLLLYKFVKKLCSLGLQNHKIDLTVITFNAQAVTENEYVNPIHSGVHGLASTIAKEFLKWNVRILDFDINENIDVNSIFGIDIDKDGNAYAMRNGKWYKCTVSVFSNIQPIKSEYKTDGVYVVIGGAGGLGEIWSKYVIDNYNSQIVWIGRRQQDEAISNKIEKISKDKKVFYVSADASDFNSLNNAYIKIKEKFGHINGVIHSAIGALDKSIINMDESYYKNVIGVKIDVSVCIAKVFCKENLDFIVFFSSIASFQKLAGQSGYATGCNFKDMYAYGLSKELNCKVKAINWGYWGNVGISESMPNSSIIRLQNSGMESIVPEKAMHAMEIILASDAPQLVYVKSTNAFGTISDEETANEDVSDNAEKDYYINTPSDNPVYENNQTAVGSSSDNGISGIDDNALSEKTVAYLKKIIGDAIKIPYSRLNAHEPLEKYGIDSILIIQLTEILKEDFSDISETLFFECRSIKEIADYLINNYHNELCKKFGISENNNPVNSEYSENVTFLQNNAVNSVLKEKTVAFLKNTISTEIKVPVSKLNANEQLEKYGIDSIIIIHLTEVLKKDFEDISETLFFECHSIEELSEYLISHYSQILQKKFGIENIAQTKQQIKQQTIKAPVSNSSDNFVTSKPTNEPIAIIGMSGRFPMADNLEQYWDNLLNGKDCITEIPQERWDLNGFYTSDVSAAVKKHLSYSKWGGFINGFAEFDPLFFRISPKEAMDMDPQERLFLEESWKTFEDAGYTRERIAKKYNGNVGVFAGVTRTGYEWYGSQLSKNHSDIRPITSFCSIANRVSFIFNLHGPSIPVDTMCSSSLSALHIACENLRWGACDMAIAGGVNIYTHPSTYIYLSQMRMLSKTGSCKSFGAGADGFVPGEGVGVVLLKPLSKAIKDKDHIYAVIKSTNLNHGGKTNGYTVPNPIAQKELIRGAIDKAGISAREISYIEAHGTGTELGDPIEIAGLTQAFDKDSKDRQYCAIGSAKANIGHLEGAAGIAGVIKTVLQMNHKTLVTSIHSEQLNPKIAFGKTPFYVQHGASEWKRPVVEINGKETECKRIAGISAFGASGTNAHAIIEEFDN